MRHRVDGKLLFLSFWRYIYICYNALSHVTTKAKWDLEGSGSGGNLSK